MADSEKVQIGMVTPEKKFRTVFGGGYQKSDVNAYILSLQQEYKSIEETLKSTINHQREEIASLHAENAELVTYREQAEALNGTLDEAKEQLRAAEQALAEAKEREAAVSAALEEEKGARREAEEGRLSLLDELERQKNTAVVPEPQKEAEATEQPSAPSADETVLSKDDYALLIEKAAQFDKMSSNIGAIVLKATADSNDILARAKAEAETVVQAANAQAEALIGGMRNKAQEINTNCHDDIFVDLEEIRNQLQLFAGTLDKKYKDINEKLDYAYAEMNRLRQNNR